MSKPEINVTPEAVEVVRQAIDAAAGEEGDFTENIGEKIGQIAWALDPQGRMALRAQKAIDSRRLVGTVQKVEFEDSTKRGMITIKAPNADEPEQFRTERTDERFTGGRQLYDAIQEWVGWECAFLLYIEKIGQTKTARIVQWFMPLTGPEEAGNQHATGVAEDPILRTLRERYGREAAISYMETLKKMGIDPFNPGDRVDEAKVVARTIADTVKGVKDD